MAKGKGKDTDVLNEHVEKTENTGKAKAITSFKKPKSEVRIRIFADPDVENMGLENYNLALYDGVYHEEQLMCLERGKVLRYVTGLDEFAPEIKLIKDADTKAARIKDIRETVAQLEKELASNVLDVDDKEFWNKVKLLKPDNFEFWETVVIRVGNDGLIFNIEDPHHIIIIRAIEAGGFDMIAKSYEDARAQAVPKKFYLDRYLETVTSRTEYTKLKNSAIAQLDKLATSNYNKLFLVAKTVDITSVQYKMDTPQDIIYENMDRFITGFGSESNKKRAAENFLNASKEDMGELKVRAVVRDAMYLKFIVLKSDSFLYFANTNTQMGRNVKEVLEYVKNPNNDKVFGELLAMVEEHWNE